MRRLVGQTERLRPAAGLAVAVLGVRMRRTATGLVLAAALSLALAVPALAAVSARLSSPHGRPGDRVALTTDDRGNPDAYTNLATRGGNRLYLVSTADYDRELQQRGSQVCGLPEQGYLGQLSWRDDIGFLSFRIPDVPPGGYYFEMTVGDQCWRVGGSSGPLVLVVGDQPALSAAGPASPSPKPRPATGASVPGPPRALWLAVAVLLGVGAAALAGRLRSTRPP